MRAFYNILNLFIGLILTSCSNQPKDYKPFADYDFNSGDYKLYGFISEGGGGDFFNKHRDFYIDNIDVLNEIKSTWNFDSTEKRMACGFEYILCLTKSDLLVLDLSINSECHYMVSDTWYDFNPKLWTIIPDTQIKHLDRETARQMQEQLFRKQEIRIPKVFVLPPHDKIANRGISPNIRECIESNLSSIDSIQLIPFSFKDLMGVAYQNIFDKKYCKPILEKVNTDFIILSKIGLRTQTGKMSNDTWDFEIKIYDVKRGSQLNSLKGKNLTSKEMCDYIEKNIKEIRIELRL